MSRPLVVLAIVCGLAAPACGPAAAPGEASDAQLRRIMRRCVEAGVKADFAPLAKDAYAGVKSAAHSERARRFAEACSASRQALNRVAPHHFCQGVLGQVENVAWTVYGVLEGGQEPHDLRSAMQTTVVEDLPRCAALIGVRPREPATP